MSLDVVQDKGKKVLRKSFEGTGLRDFTLALVCSVVRKPLQKGGLDGARPAR